MSDNWITNHFRLSEFTRSEYALRRAEATGDLLPAIYHDKAHNLSLRYAF